MVLLSQLGLIPIYNNLVKVVYLTLLKIGFIVNNWEFGNVFTT